MNAVVTRADTTSLARHSINRSAPARTPSWLKTLLARLARPAPAESLEDYDARQW